MVGWCRVGRAPVDIAHRLVRAHMAPCDDHQPRRYLHGYRWVGEWPMTLIAASLECAASRPCYPELAVSLAQGLTNISPRHPNIRGLQAWGGVTLRVTRW